jgi:hypothetical protein
MSQSAALWPLLVLLALVSSAAATPWDVGDIFATTYGRLHVIDGKTLVGDCWWPAVNPLAAALWFSHKCSLGCAGPHMVACGRFCSAGLPCQ